MSISKSLFKNLKEMNHSAYIYGLVLLDFSVNSSLWVFSVTSDLGLFRVYKLRHDHESVYKEISIAPELTHVTPEY